MPAIRKWLAGRDGVEKVLADAVREFEPDRVGSEGYADRLLGRVKRRNDAGDGFVILTFVLATIAGAVISWLIQRWLDNRFPQTQLDAWRQELGA